MKNVIKPRVKNVLIPFGLTTAESATDAAFQKKVYGPGMTKIIISNEEMSAIMNITKFLEETVLSIKGFSATIKNKAYEYKRESLSILSGILSASLFGNLLTVKGVKRSKIPGQSVMKADESTLGAGQDF